MATDDAPGRRCDPSLSGSPTASALVPNSTLRTGPVNEWRALTSHQMPTARIRPPTVSGA